MNRKNRWDRVGQGMNPLPKYMCSHLRVNKIDKLRSHWTWLAYISSRCQDTTVGHRVESLLMLSKFDICIGLLHIVLFFLLFFSFPRTPPKWTGFILRQLWKKCCSSVLYSKQRNHPYLTLVFPFFVFLFLIGLMMKTFIVAFVSCH